MTKRALNILLLLLASGLVIFGGIWFIYYLSMQQANKEGVIIACNENTQEEYIGQVTDIERFEYDEFMNTRFFSIRIETDDSLKKVINYQYNLPDNKYLSDFIEIGQIALKETGSKTFLLSDHQGNERSFLVAKCDMVK